MSRNSLSHILFVILCLSYKNPRPSSYQIKRCKCLKNTSTSLIKATIDNLLLVNSSPTGFFRSTRGLRQGDPFSSYLFVLGVEVFLMLIEKAVSKGFMSGHKIPGRGANNPLAFCRCHSFFSSFFFCNDKKEQIIYLSWILVWFEAFFGL